MSRAERTVKDAAKLYGSQLAAGAFAVIFSAWLARNLPSAELSLWPVCITLAAIVQVLSGFGISDLFVRLVPSLLQDRKRREAGALLRTGLALNVVATVLITGLVVVAAKQVTALLLHNEVEVLLVRMLGAAVLFSAMYKHPVRRSGIRQGSSYPFGIADLSAFSRRGSLLDNGHKGRNLGAVCCPIYGGSCGADFVVAVPGRVGTSASSRPRNQTGAAFLWSFGSILRNKSP